MNLIIHQCKTDWRHFRGGLLALWGLFAVQLLLAGAILNFDWVTGLDMLLLILQILFGTFLVARIIQADALAGSSAQWRTRPLGRQQLFWAKTAFILLGVVLPRLLPQMIIEGWHHYTVALWLGGLAESLLFTLVVVWFSAALAALTPDLPRFFLMLGVYLGAFFLWATLYLYLHVRQFRPQPTSVYDSTTMAVFLLFSVWALLVWLWQTLTSRSLPGLVGLGAGLLSLPWLMHAWNWDFLTPRLDPLPPLSISTLDEAAPPGGASDGQTLWSAFLVNRLPPHTLVVPELASGSFKPDGQSKTYPLAFAAGMMNGRGRNLQRRARPAEAFQGPDFVAVVRGFFPPETLWTERSTYDRRAEFPNAAEILKQEKNRPLIGELQGDWELDQFKVEAAVRVPLRPGAYTVAPGIRVVLQELKPDPDGVIVTLEEIQAAPILSRSAYDSASIMGENHRICTYVLYHPDSGEAELLSNGQSYAATPDVINGELCLFTKFMLPYPVLQERLAGISLRNFLDQACLSIFVPVYQGTIHQTFRQAGFNLSAVRSVSPTDSDDQKNLEFIEQTSLAPSPTVAQTTDYLEAILHHLPESPGAAERNTIQARLEAIGARGLPQLLARLPLDARTESDYVFPLLSKLATREQLPELRDALGRDLRLAEWFHQMNWDEDAREILVGKLSDHRLVFPPTALCLAADARDPATYADLTWRFVQLPEQQARVAAALAQCPGFDLDGAVRAAWSRVRLGLSQPGELGLLAAKQGLPDAFNQAVIQLEQSQDTQLHRLFQAQQIAALTNFKGADETAQTWLSANLGRFHYDAAAHRYLVGAGP